MSYVGKVTADGDTCPVASTLYGTCATAAGTAAKVVVCSDFDELLTGVTIHVKFTNANTVASPTLNVNSTGAKAVKRYGTTNEAAYEWVAGEVLAFTYDGTYWCVVDGGLATTTYYGVTKLSSSTSSTSTALAATPSAVKAAYDLADTANTAAAAAQSTADSAASDASSAVETATSAHYIATSTQSAISALAPRVDALEANSGAMTLSGSGTNYFFANAHCATLMCTGTGTNTQWGSTVLCTVPEGYRPWTQLYFPCQVDGSYAQSDKYIVIATDGKVTLQNAGGTQLASVYRASCSWAY